VEPFVAINLVSVKKHGLWQIYADLAESYSLRGAVDYLYLEVRSEVEIVIEVLYYQLSLNFGAKAYYQGVMDDRHEGGREVYLTHRFFFGQHTARLDADAGQRIPFAEAAIVVDCQCGL
jgi:hypothetical protein